MTTVWVCFALIALQRLGSSWSTRSAAVSFGVDGIRLDRLPHTNVPGFSNCRAGPCVRAEGRTAESDGLPTSGSPTKVQISPAFGIRSVLRFVNWTSRSILRRNAVD